MSYNGYGQYSPYWQQTTGQTTPQNPGQNAGKSTNSFQPLSAYQNNQQPSQSFSSQPAGNPGGAYGSQEFGNMNMNGAENGRPQDPRAGYSSTNDRASIDGATALGNLAYASSLGRESNNSRQQFSANYSTASPYAVGSVTSSQYGIGVEERESNGRLNENVARSQQATASPSFGYSANNVGYQGSSTGNNTQAQTQHSQSPRYSTELHRSQYSQPPRPPSSQSIQQSHSRLGSEAAPSPGLPTNQNTPNHPQVGKNNGTIRWKEQTRVNTPQSEKRPSQAPKEPSQRSQVLQATANSPVESASKKNATLYASAKETAAKRVNEVRQPPAVDSRHDQASKPATPVESQYTTVDPSQVFNHSEYSKRQAAAAAKATAAKKAAEEAEAAKLAAEKLKSDTPQVNGTEPDSAKKDQIELEMKQMIEKMRDYKAKDPSLFSQVWEQVKKSQPPQRAPSQQLQGSATSPVVVNGQSPSPSLTQNQLPPESDLPAGNGFPPDSDRGRFPAQRRRRGGSTKVSNSRKASMPEGSSEPAAKSQTAGNLESPVPPEIAIPTPKVGQIFPDPGSQSMQQAMQQFHRNSKSPLAKDQPKPGSSKQATTNNSTLPPKVKTSTAPPSQSVPAQPASTQAARAQPAPPPKSGGTYWPESKKKALAEAAQVALISTPPNQAKTISTQEIHELLDQNPSYTQMCEILEYRGFVIDRGQFARILLRAVPDLGSASTATNATSNDTASGTRATSTHATSNDTTSAIRATSTNATPTVTASTDGSKTQTTTNAISATPAAGSYGVLVKATSNGSAAQTNLPQPLPYSVPPVTAHQAPNGYVTPYAPTPPSMGQVSQGYQINGYPRDYRFFNHAAWTPPEPNHNAGVTSQGRPIQSASNFYPSFSLPQQPESTNSQVFDQNRTTHPNGVISHPPTKQDMARKRTFGEIVDLTQTLSDDEELGRHRPRPRNDEESASVPRKSIKNISDQVAQRQQNSGRATPKPFKYKYSGRDALLQSYDIVKPMNKRRDALRRSTYNPKTIARDVLLGIGKHPTMAPLNAHLDLLKDRFKAVDFDSDLSTFRWDLVDPEGEANAQPSDSDEEAVPTVSAAPRQPPAPIAVMIRSDGVDSAKDDRVPFLTVNSKGNSYKRGPYKKRSVRSEIQPIGSADKTQGQSSQGSPNAQSMGNAPSINPQDLSRFAYNRTYTPQKDLTTLSAISSGTTGSASKRKGRPPGAKNRQVRPDKGIPKKSKTSHADETTSTAKANPPREKSSSVGKASPAGISSIRKPSVLIPSRPRFTPTTPSRPNDLGNPISIMTPTDGIAVIIPSRSPSVVIATPQAFGGKIRSKKTKELSSSTQSSAPSYTISRCHWENCPAELHNLETLRKHVRKHRQAVDGVFPCLWADCSDSSNPISNNMQNEDAQHRRLKFKTDAEWVQHVESNHITT